MRGAIAAMGIALLAGSVAGCQTAGDWPVTATVQEPADIRYFPSDEPFRMGMEHFGRGHFGLAERYFRDAVEKSPSDVPAWIGLAASYDRIGRFDLADQAYQQAIRLGGETTDVLNNLGYSYILRGDLTRARTTLQKAYKQDPDNPTVINNLALLDSSTRFIQRAPQN